jgi:periplasmic divalent cation tolerance protein
MFLVYTLIDNKTVAKQMAKTLVSLKLAACVNIHNHVKSVYVWNNILESTSEHALWIKCSSRSKNACLKWLRANHPYEIPAIIVFKPSSVNAEYKKWVHLQCL